MIPRGQIHISYKDILNGIGYCLTNAKSSPAPTAVTNDSDLICLSVRTGFDLALSTLDLPPGSEIIVTDINIPDMFTIIKKHQLIAIPLPIDKHTLQVSPATVKEAITPATKAILLTHLFGAIMDIGEIADIAKTHNLPILEDCAQAYAGDLYRGHPASAVVMFSFGFIKTNTSLSGALIRINDPKLLAGMTLRNNQLPQQPARTYFKRLCKGFGIKSLTGKTIYTIFYNLITLAGKDFEQVLRSFTRGFPGNDIFAQIRLRPSNPNIRLLKYRLQKFTPQSITGRTQLARDILANIPTHYRIGSMNSRHTHWILPIETDSPDKLIGFLHANGFDASQKASSLIHLQDFISHSDLTNSTTPAHNAHSSDIQAFTPEPGITHLSIPNSTSTLRQPPSSTPSCLTLHNLVYLPMHPSMNKHARTRLTSLITSFKP